MTKKAKSTDVYDKILTIVLVGPHGARHPMHSKDFGIEFESVLPRHFTIHTDKRPYVLLVHETRVLEVHTERASSV